MVLVNVNYSLGNGFLLEYNSAAGRVTAGKVLNSGRVRQYPYI
jgi:hypothetical protein